MGVFLRLLKEAHRQECPACHKSALYKNMFEIVDECDNCGLDFRNSDIADGPVFLVTSIILLIFVPIVIWLEIKYEPMILAHILLTFPSLSIIAFYLYKISKAFMACHSYYLGKISKK